MIRRRHVIYVKAFDPDGAEAYYGLFQPSLKRFLKIWSLKGRLGDLEFDSQDFARWDVEASGPNWQVVTQYDFLRQDHIIRANIGEPLLRQIPRVLGWAFDYLVSGTTVRVLRASWKFGLGLIFFQMMLICWIGLSVGGGWLVARATMRYLHLLYPLGLAVGIIAAIAIFLALRPLARRWFVILINSAWPHLCKFARGEASCFDAPIEACARRLIAAACAKDADEIIVVGHSGGGALAAAAIARALELDHDIGRRGPPLVLVTLGSIAPGIALHPKAAKLRAVVARLATEPTVTWIDAQSNHDVLNFWNFDPVEGVGVQVGRARCNPLIWRLCFHDKIYRRIRWNFFRQHFQFITASDQRTPYDYFMLICGPVPVATWARNPDAVLAAFAADASLAEDLVISPATA